MEEKKIKVAGLIPLTLTGKPTKKLRGYTKTLNELVCYLYCFLENCAYPGNMPQATKTIGKMLQNAVFRNGILSFAFPTKIRESLNLEDRYYLSLDASAHDLYVSYLLPCTKLAYDVHIDVTGNEKRLALNKIQKLVFYSNKYVKSISIKRYGDKYITIIKLKIGTHKRIKIVEHSLNDSIYKIQEVLT